MSDQRRQRRKAVRESKLNKTSTKIDDELAVALDGYLTSDRWFAKQIKLCKKLGLEYPEKAKSGYELPLFNKNPISNDIEIHNDSADLFTAYQFVLHLADMTIGLDDTSDKYMFISMLIGVIDTDPSFGIYLHDLYKISIEKEKAFEQVLEDNNEEIIKKIEEIVARMA